MTAPEAHGPDSPQAARARAVALLRQGEPRKALDLLQRVSRPEDPDDAFLMGEAALRCGQYAQAEKAYRRVLRFRPEDLVASTRLARIAFLEARYAEARKQLDWILARSPDRVEARGLRSRIRLRLGDLNGAAADARRWARLDPHDAEPLRILGVVQRLRGDPGGAVEVLERAVAVDPSHLPSRLELARAYGATGQNRRSDEAFREAARLERAQLALARRRADASYHRVQALERLEAGDATGALANYRDALAHDPENPDLLREAGEAALASSRPEEALAYLDRALKVSASNSLVRRVRGEILLAQKDPEGALPDLLEAARLDPTDPAIHRVLAKAYKALHRPEAEREEQLAIELEKKAAIPSSPEGPP